MDPVGLTWSFGDGVTVEGALDVVHTYMTSGNYTVTLTAVAADGTAHSDSLPITEAFPTDVGFVAFGDTGGLAQNARLATMLLVAGGVLLVASRRIRR